MNVKGSKENEEKNCIMYWGSFVAKHDKHKYGDFTC
jgi:hypothetical protein